MALRSNLWPVSMLLTAGNDIETAWRLACLAAAFNYGIGRNCARFFRVGLAPSLPVDQVLLINQSIATGVGASLVPCLTECG